MPDTIQLPVRLDRETYEELHRRAQLQGVSMNQLIRELLKAHFTAVPVSKRQLRDAIKRIAHDDAKILDALKKM